LTQISFRLNLNHIYMIGFSSASFFQNTKLFPNIRSKSFEIARRSSSGFNSSENSVEKFLSIRASLAKYKDTIAFVSSRASSRCLRFVDPIFGLTSIDGFLLVFSEHLLLRRVFSIADRRSSSFSSQFAQLIHRSPSTSPSPPGAPGLRLPTPMSALPSLFPYPHGRTPTFAGHCLLHGLARTAALLGPLPPMHVRGCGHVLAAVGQPPSVAEPSLSRPFSSPSVFSFFV
jgi:hypothetical protein